MKEDVRRMSRGQSHDLCTRLENEGLTTDLAAGVVEKSPSRARAMVVVAMQGGYWYERAVAWFREKGVAFKIPEPPLTIRDEIWHTLKGQALRYRPPSRLLPTEALLAATVSMRNRYRWRGEIPHVAWESTEEGYWFWTDDCVITPIEDLGPARGPLARRILKRCESLEEFMLAQSARNPVVLPHGRLLRTRLAATSEPSYVVYNDGGEDRLPGWGRATEDEIRGYIGSGIQLASHFGNVTRLPAA